MDDLQNQWDPSSILCWALSIISKPSVNSNWSYSPETFNSNQNWQICLRDLEILDMTLKNNRAPLLCYIKLCASFQHHSNWSYSPETLNLGQNRQFSVPCDLEIWWMTLKNNRAPLLCYFKLCASFQSHMWIQTGVTVWKRLNWLLTSVTLTFALWSWPFAWTSLLSLVIIPENFMMIQWWEHSEKAVTDRQTDGLNHS